MKKLIILLSLTVIFLTGCTRLLAPSETVKAHIVTSISISVSDGPESRQILYSDPRKIEKVLNYLRLMESWDVPQQNPDIIEGPRYRIELHLSDDTRKTYEQVRLDCFKEGLNPWRTITPEYALHLPLILAAVPSDAI